jgi:TPR repeat protein
MSEQYFKSAALKGHAHAQYEYAEALMDGRGVGKDEKEATAWYERAAIQGDAEAQFVSGLMSAKGWGVPKDRKISEFWLLKAHLEGHPRAGEVLKKLKSFQ